jgi:peptidoglycan-associated lipoprotein
MKNSTTKGIALLIGFFCVTCALGCHHAIATKAEPAVPTPQPAPTATLAANPAYVERGQPTTLSWQTSNATDVDIQGLGTVPASGSRSITPSQSTSYELTAKGPGGTADASARVTVNMSYAAAPQTHDGSSDRVEDVYFDYDRYNIRPEQMAHLQADARYLERHDGMRVLIEGHCDDRGSLEYNLALGAKRASAVQQALVQLGVPARHLQTVSYGKERPFCTKENEQCWQQNRRGHFTEHP